MLNIYIYIYIYIYAHIMYIYIYIYIYIIIPPGSAARESSRGPPPGPTSWPPARAALQI